MGPISSIALSFILACLAAISSPAGGGERRALPNLFGARFVDPSEFGYR